MALQNNLTLANHEPTSTSAARILGRALLRLLSKHVNAHSAQLLIQKLTWLGIHSNAINLAMKQALNDAPFVEIDAVSATMLNSININSINPALIVNAILTVVNSLSFDDWNITANNLRGILIAHTPVPDTNSTTTRDPRKRDPRAAAVDNTVLPIISAPELPESNVEFDEYMPDAEIDSYKDLLVEVPNDENAKFSGLHFAFERIKDTAVIDSFEEESSFY